MNDIDAKLSELVRSEIDNYFRSNVETDFWGYNLNRLSWLKAGMESVDYMLEKLYDTHQSANRLNHISYILSKVEVEGLYLEFGVGHNGESIKVISDNIGENLVYGFDTFKGLPEKWGNVLPKGAFYNCGKPPKLDQTNIVFVKGLFDKTLPPFAEEHAGKKCAFINVDCDLYSSTKTVFDCLADKIEVGTVINFDEYFNYPGWQKHEYKAWMEFIEKYNVEYEYLSFVPNDMCLAVKITAITK
jgi:hypothetical protein